MENISKQLALYISALLGPYLWGPVLIALTLHFSGLKMDRQILLFLILLIFQFVIPVGYILILVRQGKVSSWDLPDKSDRPKVLFVGVCSLLVSIVFLLFLGNFFLLWLSLLMVILGLVAGITSKFWKISLHAGINAAGTVLVNYFFHWQLLWLFITVPLVFWARYRLKRHSLKQLIAGALLGGGMAYFWLSAV